MSSITKTKHSQTSNAGNHTVKKGKKVAVIGSGISGISAAWFLSQEHEVTLFEKNPKIGGHTNTIELELEGKKQPVDTGFIVFNTPNYPLLTAMFEHLSVATQNTEMSFSVSVNEGELEYSGNNLDTMFAQRKNLFSAKHWKMISEILRFNKRAKADLDSDSFNGMDLGEYLHLYKFSNRMRDYYLLPMAAAIWSCPVEQMMKFPVNSFLRFFENHGLLNIEDRPQWESVVNGSHQYLKAILALQSFEVKSHQPVSQVEKTDLGMVITAENGQKQVFDEVVFAAHADETYTMLSDDLKAEYQLLENFKYQENIAYLHSDESLMPKRKKAWAAWNYLRDIGKDTSSVAVTYWMNLLQNIDIKTPLLVTLNPIRLPSKSLTHQKIVYQHPVFDIAAMDAQNKLQSIQGSNNLWFCGSYFGYGFHEDGLKSSADLAKLWNIALPWQQEQVAQLTRHSSDANTDTQDSESSNMESHQTALVNKSVGG
ncbi:NAD(P)/FAD-dependent oxidoreductase [Thiomicrorhabdus sp.]|uniref:NAD(P)/FAD-dependent oxidoreductase n=1 Tax=Thiomicrorhabdus sp. TaxID=2039724 RepID=UPI002AA76219|nr:FAD-dependent oxidoreductase [Thiomicrorhabdus sp.]